MGGRREVEKLGKVADHFSVQIGCTKEIRYEIGRHTSNNQEQQMCKTGYTYIYFRSVTRGMLVS